jgi:hypothetical protein
MAQKDPKEIIEIEATEETAAPERFQLAARRPRKVYAGMWGPIEIGAVAAGALAIVAALVVYFFFVIASNRELTTNKSEADRLDAELLSANSKYGEITSTETQVSKLLSSVDDFQTSYLPVASVGQAALYQRINGLISSYDLVNTSGPDYAPLNSVDTDNEKPTDEERGRAKFQSLFPGVYVGMTVEGSYQNLRRFVREIETGQEFVIISTIELAPSDTQKQNDITKPAAANTRQVAAGSPSTGPGAMPGGIGSRGITPNQPMVQSPAQFAQAKKGKMHGEIVSLHIEMAAYFRRGAATMPVTQQ